MARSVALALGLLLAATASATALIEADPAADAQAVSSTRSPVSTKVRANSDRVHLTLAEINSSRMSGLWPPNVRSLLNIRRRLAYGDFVWNDEAVPPGELSIRVDLRTQLISVLRGGHEIGTAVILYGADSHRTPEGTFPIKQKIRDHVSRTYDAPMPYALRLTADGVAIHGSRVRYGAATHGCIGVPLEFAERLFDEAHLGNKVLIVRSPQ